MVLPDMKVGQTLPLIKLNPNQHFTKPVNPADIEKLVARLRGDDASLAEPIR